MRIVFIACLFACILSYSCKNKSQEQAQSSLPSLTDHSVVQKQVKTLGMIEKYQQLSYPGTKGLEIVNREYDRVIQKTDSLMR